ncbi:MAG: hypothetical protein H0S85_14930 [Desulfovibrionaceae bacterium]|jgi:hypothetical protein|nr:hypothetical protein [Desulfovibrionaceae bacterium]
MPHIAITTNVELEPAAAQDLALAASRLCAEIFGKPEQYVQALVTPGAALVHGGATAPAAYVECKSIGLPSARAAELSRAVCAFLQERIGVDPTRAYIEFKDLDRALFGWDSGTF